MRDNYGIDAPTNASDSERERLDAKKRAMDKTDAMNRVYAMYGNKPGTNLYQDMRLGNFGKTMDFAEDVDDSINKMTEIVETSIGVPTAVGKAVYGMATDPETYRELFLKHVTDPDDGGVTPANVMLDATAWAPGVWAAPMVYDILEGHYKDKIKNGGKNSDEDPLNKTNVAITAGMLALPFAPKIKRLGGKLFDRIVGEMPKKPTFVKTKNPSTVDASKYYKK